MWTYNDWKGSMIIQSEVYLSDRWNEEWVWINLRSNYFGDVDNEHNSNCFISNFLDDYFWCGAEKKNDHFKMTSQEGFINKKIFKSICEVTVGDGYMAIIFISETE